MFLLVIGLIVAAAIVCAYLVDRHDRKNGHEIGSGPEFRARIRAARKQSRDTAWGRARPGRGGRTDKRRAPGTSRGRRSQ